MNENGEATPSRASATFATRAEFADMQGWSRSYVTKLGRAGRLVLSKDRRLVNVPESLQLIASTSSAERAFARLHNARRRSTRQPQPHRVPEPEEIADYNRARTQRMIAEAATAQAKVLAIREGLCRRSDVCATARLIHELVVEAFPALSPRIEAAWQRGDSPAARERLLEDELDKFRSELADKIEARLEPAPAVDMSTP